MDSDGISGTLDLQRCNFHYLVVVDDFGRVSAGAYRPRFHP